MNAIMKKSGSIRQREYNRLLKTIGSTVESARTNASRAVNSELVNANWLIGKRIVEFEQKGDVRAEYGSELLTKLARDLQRNHGKGFSRRNVSDMRRFYLSFPIWQPVAAKLSWTHHTILLGIHDESKRKFYSQRCLNESWSKRDLERQIDSSLYERLALRGRKRKVAAKLNSIPAAVNSTRLIKDPYVLDFLNIPHNHKVTEKHLEQKIIDHLQMFLLELGKGFAFVGRQYKISLRNKHFYVDLVFYHRILKCFVLIDLKTKAVCHSDIGQMNLYLNYFKKEENVPGDNEPIGIILSAEKDEILVEYATGGLSNKIFVSKYQLYLPGKIQLKRQVQAAFD